jgi:branched-subunit amino acid aminotransferase/4-amino-4-deoxychorismate lyase
VTSPRRKFKKSAIHMQKLTNSASLLSPSSPRRALKQDVSNEFLEHWKAVRKQPWLLRQFWRTDEHRVKFKPWGGLRHNGGSYLVALITSLPYLRYEKPTMLSLNQQTTSKQKEKHATGILKDLISKLDVRLYTPKNNALVFVTFQIRMVSCLALEEHACPFLGRQ